MFDKFFKTRYVEVPPCPRCNSHKTGFYVYSADGVISNLLIQKKYLKSGQRVRVTNYSCSEMGKNVFCEKCGIEWMAKLHTKYVTKEELEILMSDKEVSLEDIEKTYKKGEGTDIFGKKKKKPMLKRVAGSILNSIQRRAGDDGEDIDDDDDDDDDDEYIYSDINKINEENDDDAIVMENRRILKADYDDNDEEVDKNETEEDEQGSYSDRKYRRYKVINDEEDEE